MRIFCSFLGALVFVAAVTAGQAQTIITSLPYVISTGGLYVLASNLSSTQTTGGLIEVNASNVTIDFQSHYISGPVGNSSQDTFGILADERSNLTIKNGTIAYCNIGIYIYGNGTATTNNVDQQVDNMRVTYCYSEGIELDNAPSSRVTNCLISQIGFTGFSGATGVYLIGAGVTLQGNSVSNLIGSGTVAIRSAAGSFARQNQVSSATSGIVNGIYQDNLAHACTTAFSGGTDAGGNTHD